MSTKKRVSTRVTLDQYRFLTAMASVQNVSVSKYLKQKLFESKNQLTDQQLEKVMTAFCQRVDVLKLDRIKTGIALMLKKHRNDELPLTKDEYSSLLLMKHDLGEIEKGVDVLCQLYL